MISTTQTETVPLSLAMIVKDEEKNLARCLASVQGVVDEIVVLDTGSSDRTLEIAQDFGARIYHYQWQNHFSQARNYGLQFVRGEWILVLDADEALTAAIVPFLSQAIANPQCLVVNLIRQEVGAAQSPYSLVSRLFRNHPQVKFTRPYHSIVDDRVAELLEREPNWQITDLTPVAILHYGYQPEAIAALNKYDRARRAMESYLAEHPHDAYACCKLGALYGQIERQAEGLALLERGLQAEPSNPHLLFELHYHLGNAYRQADPNRAAIHYQTALAQPILPQLKLGAYNNLGSLLQQAGQPAIALKIYQSALNIDPSLAVTHYNLGMALRATGQFSEAIAAYQRAVELNPNYAWAYQNWGVILLKLGKLAESRDRFARAIALHEAQNNTAEAQRLRQGLREIAINL